MDVSPRPIARAGPPLVLLDGFTDMWRTWELALPALERRHDVLAPTLPGHAGGPPLRADVRADDLADSVERAMDESGFETAHVAGNSLGGYVALQLAARGRARSVVALSPAGGRPRTTARSTTRSITSRPCAGGCERALPHADALAATAEGRRRATRFLTERSRTSAAGPGGPPAGRRRGVHGGGDADRRGPRGRLAARPCAHRRSGARGVGDGGPPAAMAGGRRALPPRLAAARRLGGARRRRPLPAARRPAGDGGADPRVDRG